MRRLEFEQLILEMVFEVGYEKLTPATVAYFLRIPIKTAEAHLDELAKDSVLDIEVDDSGRIFYVLPSPFEPSDQIMNQTVMRRSARGLGSHFAVAELAKKSEREDDALPVSDVIRDAQRREREGTSPAPSELDAPHAEQSHPLVLPDPREPAETDVICNYAPERSDSSLVPAEPSEADLAALRTAPNPAVPMLLSFFWPGLGQIHNGQPGKGLLMFFTSAFLWLLFLGWVVTIYSVIDAGVIAGQRREDHIRRALTA